MNRIQDVMLMRGPTPSDSSSSNDGGIATRSEGSVTSPFEGPRAFLTYAAKAKRRGYAYTDVFCERGAKFSSLYGTFVFETLMLRDWLRVIRLPQEGNYDITAEFYANINSVEFRHGGPVYVRDRRWIGY